VAILSKHTWLSGGFDMFQPLRSVLTRQHPGSHPWADRFQLGLPGTMAAPGFGAGPPILRHVQFVFPRFPIDGGRIPCGVILRNSAETD